MDIKNTSLYTQVDGFLHGGDYNPDQWLDQPEVIKEDYRLIKLAGCNTFSLNIFGWSAIEPKEGQYDFTWLDKIIDDLADINASVILATPSGARPAWLSKEYPEVLRVEENRKRNLHGKRHNHCLTSPVYREKTAKLNRMLAERYEKKPNLIMWHISNEYGGACHCTLCEEAFRDWLKKKYNNDLNQLNKAWWTSFWSHTYSDWSQIESPAPHGEDSVHAHNLDWKRFVTDQTIDFYKNEIAPLREITPLIPVTTNFMGDYPEMGPYKELNYIKFSEVVDIASWDAYPAWHNDWQTTADLAAEVAFVHDLYRSIKDGQPFLIMENTPSLVNWHNINKPKTPKMHQLSAWQSIAHGADSILYFQWRKSRGAFEKFHGAVVDHNQNNIEKTRVFQEVSELGKLLKKVKAVKGTRVNAKVAIIYDWENQWAIDDAMALNLDKKDYIKTCQSAYKSFWKQGIPVDVISLEKDISKYDLIIAPMLYMLRSGMSEKIEEFVSQGGNFVTTYWSGVVDEHDLCFTNGFPGPLQRVLGIWTEEIDTLYGNESNQVTFTNNNDLTIQGSFKAYDYCEVIHPTTAKTIAMYDKSYYASKPAVTVNDFGQGKAYYIGSRNEQAMQDELFYRLAKTLKIDPPLKGLIPSNISVQKRGNFTFVMNFDEVAHTIIFDQGMYRDLLTDIIYTEKIELQSYQTIILEAI